MRYEILANLPLILLLWAVIYAGDYGLTLLGARAYATILKPYVVFESSYELNPYYQADINARRLVSPRFLFALAATLALLALVWYLTFYFLGDLLLIELAFGMYVLMEAVVYLRHLRNLALAHFLPAGGMDGQVRYTRGFSLKLSAAEALSFAGLYFLLMIWFGSWFFLGGCVACLSLSLNHWRLAQRAIKKSQALAG